MKNFKWLPVLILVVVLFGCSTPFQRQVKLSVSSEPGNVKIYEDEKYVGEAPLDLVYKYVVKRAEGVGTYYVYRNDAVVQNLLRPRTFTARKDGFKPQSKSFQFPSDHVGEFAHKSYADWRGEPDFFTQTDFSLRFDLEPLGAGPGQQQRIDRMGSAVIETFRELNLPAANVETASGLITTDWISFKGQKDKTGYCTCGATNPPLKEVDRRGKISVSLGVMNNSVEMKVDAVFEKVAQYKEIVDTTPCVSTGKLEAEIRRRVSEKIK